MRHARYVGEFDEVILPNQTYLTCVLVRLHVCAFGDKSERGSFRAWLQCSLIVRPDIELVQVSFLVSGDAIFFYIKIKAA